MVRLKVIRLILLKCRVFNFNSTNGAIKSVTVFTLNNPETDFNSTNGAIKSQLTGWNTSPLYNFNSTNGAIKRLLDLRPTRSATSISIPQMVRLKEHSNKSSQKSKRYFNSTNGAIKSC